MIQIRTVVIFGDSLSDIGIKWKSKAGQAALALRQMYVNPSGRFSDSRNWVDHMIEEATGIDQILATPQATVARSQAHLKLSKNSWLTPLGDPDDKRSFYYANYAEGGACGDRPASKEAFLGTFKDQVNRFERDLMANPDLKLGNTLFIIWFGANDLYTAERDPAQMAAVANEVSATQRDRLKSLVESRGSSPHFLFVNLARALSTVRYTRQLVAAIHEVARALDGPFAPERPPGSAASLLWHARQTLARADLAREIAVPRRAKEVVLPEQDKAVTVRERLKKAALQTKEATSHQAREAAFGLGRLGRARTALKELIDKIDGFDRGVMNYNTQLNANRAVTIVESKGGKDRETNRLGDMLAEIGTLMSEHTLARLEGESVIKLRAMERVAVHVPSVHTRDPYPAAPITAIDEVHPTDVMYQHIWMAIRAVLLRHQVLFGKLITQRRADEPVKDPASLIDKLSGPDKGLKTRNESVLAQIRERAALRDAKGARSFE